MFSMYPIAASLHADPADRIQTCMLLHGCQPMAVITVNASSTGRSYNELPAHTFLSDSVCMR